MGAPEPPQPVAPATSVSSVDLGHVIQEANRSEEETSQSAVVEEEGGSETHGSAAGALQDQQLQNEGILLAFVGNKLGEYNLRGVEAGMSMVGLSEKAGKALNTKTRLKGRIERSPYERRPGGKKDANAPQVC